MSGILWFLLGVFVGMMVGIMVAGLCVAARMNDQ